MSGLPAGFTARPITLDDLEVVSALLNETAREMYGEGDFSLEMLRTILSSPQVDLSRDTLAVFSAKGEMVAYASVLVFDEIPVHPHLVGRVLAGYRGLGLGTFLLAFELERAREVARRVPREYRVSARVNNPMGFGPASELLEAEGFRVFRHSLHMRIELDREIPEPVLPDGIRWAPYLHPEQAPDVYRASEEAFQDHFGYVPESFETGFPKFERFHIEDDGFDPALWFVALAGDEIAGVSLCRRWSYGDHRVGWVSTLGVIRTHRRKGIARALLLASFRAFRERGRRAADLSVDAENLTGAVALYEQAGMYIHRRDEVYDLELRSGRELGLA